MVSRTAIRAALAGMSCALLLTGCDKVVRIGTSLPEQSSPDGGSGGAATSSPTGGAPTDTTGGTASSSGGSGPTSEPDAGAEPDMTEVVTQPEQAVDNAPNTDCGDAVDATPRWSFSADGESWQISNSGAATLNWSDAQGMPSAGALLVAGDKPPGDDLYVFIPLADRDLSGTIATFNVLLEAGDDLYVKLFALSGDDYLWVDGGIVRITAGAWTCLALDIEAPAFRTDGFDPARVRRIGVGINGTDFRIFLDELSY